MTSSAGGLTSGLVFLILWSVPHVALAAKLDIGPDTSDMNIRIQQLHHISLWVCVVVGVIVFGAMFYTMFAHRRSRSATAATFNDSTLVEVIWTLIPVLILVGIAIPATTAWRGIKSNDDSEATSLIPASHWKWRLRHPVLVEVRPDRTSLSGHAGR